MSEKNNKSNIIIVLLVILIFLVISIGGWLIYEKTTESKNSIENNNNINEQNKNIDNSSSSEKVKNYEVKKLDFSQCIANAENCKQDIIEVTTDHDEAQKWFNVLINGNLASSGLVLNSEIYIIDNVVIISTNNASTASTTISAFDQSGNKIFDYSDVGNKIDNNHQSMSIKYTKNNISLKVEDNKIIIGGSRLVSEKEIMTDNGYINICDNPNEIVEGVYEIEYLGNNKFSDIKNVKYVSAKDMENYINNCK